MTRRKRSGTAVVHSAARQKTERSMLSRARQRFEDDLKYLNEVDLAFADA